MPARPYQRFYDTWANSFGEDRILEMIEDGSTIAALQRHVYQLLGNIGVYLVSDPPCYE